MKTLLSMTDDEVHDSMRNAFNAITTKTESGKEAMLWMKQNGYVSMRLNIADAADCDDDQLMSMVKNPEEAIVAYVAATFSFKKAQMTLDVAGDIPAAPVSHAKKLSDIAEPLTEKILCELEELGFPDCG